MNFAALIDFNKYTLAVSAAGFLYALEKIGPMASLGGRILQLAVLVIFLVAVLLAVGVFSAATAAHHADTDRTTELEGLVQKLGIAHAIALSIGLLILGGVVVDRVLSPPDQGATKCRCCED